MDSIMSLAADDVPEELGTKRRGVEGKRRCLDTHRFEMTA
jgi:hypothetical protein